MKVAPAALALFAAASLAAQTTTSSPAHPHAGANRGAQVCAGGSDAENYCAWDSAAGTHGRKCTLDVEKIRNDHPCDFTKPSMADMADHKPMCISIQQAEHITFSSGKGRQFRVRRLVPITARNFYGKACPKDPFQRAFDEHDLTFAGSVDTDVPKASARGCKYKLEVQFHDEDANAPAEPNDPGHHHYECRDPHLLVKSAPGM